MLVARCLGKPPQRRALLAARIGLPDDLTDPCVLRSIHFSPPLHAQLAFDAHRNAHATTDAQRRDAASDVAPGHLVQQRHQNPRP